MPNSVKRRGSSVSQESCSAVIVADLVADVQPESRQASIRSNRSTKSATKGAKEAEAGACNGASSISRGVILNALHSGQLDAMADKPVHLSSVFTVTAIDTKDAEQAKKDEGEVGGFSEMSPARKVAFALSFLPSLMFVLCFAVILPCNRHLPALHPCATPLWMHQLNDSDLEPPTLSLPHSVLVARTKGHQGSVLGLNASSGEALFQTAPREGVFVFMDCDHLGLEAKKTCLLQDDSGELHLIHAANGEPIVSWRTSTPDEKPSLPVLLASCRAGGASVVGVATARDRLTLLFDGAVPVHVDVGVGCDALPRNLRAWQREGKTDILFTCQSEDGELLVVLPQSKWCDGANTSDSEATIYLKSASNISSFLPVEDGVFAWAGNKVFKFDTNSSLQWTAASDGHFPTNRFLLYGHFEAEGKQVALFSSNETGESQMSTLGGTDGKLMFSHALPGTELIDVVTVTGEKTDLVAMLKKKITQEEESLAGTVMLTLEGLLLEPLNETRGPVAAHQVDLMLLQRDQQPHNLYSRKMEADEGESYESSFRVVRGESEKDLRLFIVHSSRGQQKAEVTSLLVTNWDVASSSEASCPK